MNTKVQKWGNSLGIRLPMSITKSLNIRQNTLIELKIQGNKIIIHAVKEAKYNLNDLVSKVNDSNRHNELSYGKETGNEVW